MARPTAEHHEFDGDLEHALPAYTTPQGVQEGGVVHGHEERDTNLGAVGKWFIGLAISTVASIFLLAGVYRLWEGMMKQAEAVPPALQTSQTPPEPRLIPNPVDDHPDALDPIRSPIERNIEYQQQMDEDVAKLGLHNAETGLAAIPADTASQVAQSLNGGGPPTRPANAPRTDGVEFHGLSDSSGGTVEENTLR